MLNNKDIIEKLLAELKDLPVEERNRCLEALKADIDAVICPVVSGEGAKDKLPDGNQALKPDEAKPLEKNDNEESDEARAKRLFGE